MQSKSQNVGMKIGTVFLAGVLLTGAVNAQSSPQPRRGTAESSLVGVTLYDVALRVVNLYGSPDEIQGINVGGTGATGGPGTGSGPAGTGGGAAGGGGQGPSAGVAQESNTPFYGDPFNDNAWRQFRPGQAGENGTPPPPGTGSAGGGAAGGRGGVPGSGGGSSGRVELVRWVYHRGSSRYAFVMDRFSRVVQIEAIGMNDSKPRTRRGIAFGSSFASIIRAYVQPDAYELIGDTIVVRFLVKDRVAFRLQRLRANGPHVVTGIVVAAAKE